MCHAVHRAEGVALGDELPARQHLGQHKASGEHVHARRRLQAVRGFGRHVARRAHHLLLVRRVLDARGDAEVHHPRPPLPVDEDVRGFQVTVHHTGLMGHFERVEHARHHLDRLAHRQRATRPQVRRERAARHVFEDEIRLLLVHVAFEHRHDVRVVEPAHAARFLEPLARRGGIGAGQHQLDGHLALQPRVERQPHGGLRALAKLAAQLEAAQGLGGGGRGHGGLQRLRDASSAEKSVVPGSPGSASSRRGARGTTPVGPCCSVPRAACSPSVRSFIVIDRARP